MTQPKPEIGSSGPPGPALPELHLTHPTASEGAFLNPGPNESDFSKPREYSLEELHALFTPAEIQIIEAAQHFQAPKIKVVIEKADEEFVKRLDILANNIGTYEDDIEDAIASDLVIQEFISQHKKLEDRASASEVKEVIVKNIHIRRSVVAYITSQPQT